MLPCPPSMFRAIQYDLQTVLNVILVVHILLETAPPLHEPSAWSTHRFRRQEATAATVASVASAVHERATCDGRCFGLSASECYSCCCDEGSH